MNVKKPTTLRVVLVAIVFLLIGVGGITFVKWQKSQPSVKNFDREIRAMIALSGSDSKDAYGEETESNCIYWPNPPAPFGQSRGRLEMATHTDIAINGPQSEGTLAYVKKVEALTRLGLLEKSQVTSFISGEKKEVNRYRLSPMGWRAYSFSRNGACFKYGLVSGICG